MRRFLAFGSLLLLGLLGAALLFPRGVPTGPALAPGGGESVARAAAEPAVPSAESPQPARVPSGPQEGPAHPPAEAADPYLVAVEGRVSDSAGGPVEGARVAGTLGGDPAALVVTATGKDGSFRLSLPARETPRAGTAEVVLLASAEGFAPTLVHGMRPAWNRALQVGAIALLRPGSVEGKVLGPDGEPARDADVRATPQGPWASLAPVLGWGPTAVRTDAAGAFRLGGIPPGGVRVAASLEGLLGATRDDLLVAEGKTSGGVELLLREGAFVAGSALDDSGRPVAGAQVRFAPGGGDRTKTGVSDGSGRFRLGPLAPEEEGILSAWNEAACSLEVPAKSGPEAYELRLSVRTVLAGRVLEAAGGRPIPKAAVRLEKPRGLRPGSDAAPRPNQPWSAASESPSTSDGTGAFSIPLSSSGWYRVLACAEGFGAARSDWVRVQGGAASAEAVVRLDRGRRIAGRVVSSSGSAVPRAEVSARGPTGAEVPVDGVPAVNGRFEIGGLRPGNYRLTAWAPGLEGDRRDVLVPEGTDPDPVEIVLRAASGIAGLVVLPSAPPRGSLAVLARARSGSTTGMAFAGPEGRFEIVPLPPGPYRVEARFLPLERNSSSAWQAHAAGLFPTKPGSRVAEVTVPEGGVAEVVLEANPAAAPRIFGTVRRAGQPLDGVEIRAQGKGGSSSGFQRSARTGGDGAYELWLPLEGSFEVQARETEAPAPSATRMVEAASGTDQEVSFDLVSGEIRGAAAADDGGPVANLHARLSWRGRRDGHGPGSSRKGESGNGRFAFRGLPPGSYTLALWADGRGVRLERVDLEGGEARDLGDVLLPREIPLTVTVQWEDGPLVLGGSVRVEDASGNPLPPLDRSGPEIAVRDGSLRIGHLGPGSWRLRMNRPRRATLEILLPDSGPVDLVWGLSRQSPTGESEDGD
ncbi:MAG TPA: carboxypeptidase-like regulatory domain-containing protein [Planctomycetota bacterium]|jgi:hypothetical protein|nr:carboxypeptidase-like regulatory domain-containing protein [Planctomycetota bacterium]